MIMAMYGWQCEKQFEDDPLKVFENDSYNHEGNPFDLQPPLPERTLSRWYARLPPTARITKLGAQVSYTLANGMQPELAVNKEFHIAMPTTFKPERMGVTHVLSRQPTQISPNVVLVSWSAYHLALLIVGSTLV